MSEVLAVRESRLLEMSKENIELQESSADLQRLGVEGKKINLKLVSLFFFLRIRTFECVLFLEKCMENGQWPPVIFA